MLVKAVMKYTPHNHPDYTYLEKAIEKIDAVAAYVDERIEHACNRMKIISLQQEYNIPVCNDLKKLIFRISFNQVEYLLKKETFILY